MALGHVPPAVTFDDRRLEGLRTESFALSGLTASSRMRKEQPMSDEKPMGQVIQIDEARIRDLLGEMARETVEETLNAMLDAEADQLCGAGRYERSDLGIRAQQLPERPAQLEMNYRRPTTRCTSRGELA
jgi:hypothetical protein